MSATGDQDYIPAKHPWLLLGTVMLMTLMTTIDATIANVALPHMQGSLSATQDQIGWVLTSYIVATAIFTPPTGFLANRFGRQRMLGWCVGGFLVTSMLCGAATSLTEIVIFRTLQGAFAASITPLGQTIIMDHYPPHMRAQMLSVWGVGAMLGPIIGPTLGGYLTETWNWRWVFYVNVPICLVALLGVWRTIPHSDTRRDTRFDLFGFALLSLAIGAFQLMLDRGQSVNWFESGEICVEATVAGLCFYLFLAHIFTAKAPFIEPRLFKDRNLVVGLLMVVFTSMMLMGQMALLPAYLQQLMHIPVDTTGFLMMPRGISSMFGMLLAARLINHVDPRALMIVGLLILGHSLYQMSQINLYVDNFTIMRIGLQQGLGVSIALGPMNAIVFSTLSAELRTEGASMYNLMRNIGGSVGISLLFTRVAQLTQITHARLGEHITTFSDPASLPQAWNWSSTAGAMSLDAEITRQAASVAYLNAYFAIAALALLTIPLCLLFRPHIQRAPAAFDAVGAEH